eukprot:344573_1
MLNNNIVKKWKEEKDDDENKENESNYNQPNMITYSKQQKKRKNIDLNDATFANKVHYGLNDIDLKDKLLVIGYIKKVAVNKYKMDIPQGIINYCIAYLFFVEESELYIGNLHELEETTARNRHNWTMFISTSKQELIKPKTIKEVIYYLHPTFHPSECTERESPFYLRRLGWGTFAVEAKIIFKNKYKRKDCFTSHGLSFSRYASITQIDLNQSTRIKDLYAEDDRERYFFGNSKKYPTEYK